MPPHGACLLGSFNLVKYVRFDYWASEEGAWFDFRALESDVYLAVRLLDNVIDQTDYPHAEQRQEAREKRRMGLGVTGLANALEALGLPYGSHEFIEKAAEVFATIRDAAYDASAELAGEKGPFPLFDAEKYDEGAFIKTLPTDIRSKIYHMGIRNSHLISFAPTGTISLAADNVSSGIEPVFSYGFDRTINMPDGQRTERVEDYGVRVFGVQGKTADQLTPLEHVNVQAVAQQFCDSAVSKTCNIGPDVTFEEFKNVYLRAWELGAKGCTTYRADGKRAGILVAVASEDSESSAQDVVYSSYDEGSACYIDPTTGTKSCG